MDYETDRKSQTLDDVRARPLGRPAARRLDRYSLELYGFEQGKALLSPVHETAIDELRTDLRVVNGVPDWDWWRHIDVVEGAASPEGTERANDSVSSERAINTVHSLESVPAGHPRVSDAGTGHLAGCITAIGEAESQGVPAELWPWHRRVRIKVSPKKAKRIPVPREKEPEPGGDGGVLPPDHTDPSFGKWASTAGKTGAGIAFGALRVLAPEIAGVGAAGAAGALGLFGGIALFGYSSITALGEANESHDRYASTVGWAYGAIGAVHGKQMPAAPGDLSAVSFGQGWSIGSERTVQGLEDALAAFEAAGRDPAKAPDAARTLAVGLAILTDPELCLNRLYQAHIDESLDSATKVVGHLASGRYLTWPTPTTYTSVGDNHDRIERLERRRAKRTAAAE